jgi:hypothetical protein
MYGFESAQPAITEGGTCMRKFLVVALIIGLILPAMAMSAEVVLDVTITDMVEKTDKNGNDYVRFIAEMPKELQGTQYTVGTPIMAFGAAVEKAKTYSVGDTLKCIAKYREWNSRESYTILAYLE